MSNGARAAAPSWSSRLNHSAAATSAIVFVPLVKLVSAPLIGSRATVPLACIVPRPTSRSAGLSTPWMQ